MMSQPTEFVTQGAIVVQLTGVDQRDIVSHRGLVSVLNIDNGQPFDADDEIAA